jgi:hypothetical protein
VRHTRYDLAAALPALIATGRYGALVEHVERAIWTGSAHEDLSAARDALRLLRRLTKEVGFDERFEERERPTMAGALFSHAIILYARATHTRPVQGERNAWFGEGQLKGENRRVHKEVTGLRDKVVAHFGRGKHLAEGPIVKETLVLRPAERGVFLTFYSSRAQNRGALAASFLALTEEVLALAYNATQARYAEIGAELKNAALAGDRELLALLNRFPFDPSAYSMHPDWQRQVEDEGGIGTWWFPGVQRKPDPPA